MESITSGMIYLENGKWTPISGWSKFEKIKFAIKDWRIWCLFKHKYQYNIISGYIEYDNLIAQIFTKKNPTDIIKGTFILQRCPRCGKKVAYFEDLCGYRKNISIYYFNKSDWEACVSK